MISIRENIICEHITTWHIPYKIRYYCRIESAEDIAELCRHPLFLDAAIEKSIVGKGANTLISRSFYDGLLIYIDIKGKEMLREDSDHSYWKIMAGEDWSDLVRFFVFEEKLWGMENLALIPGSAGAAPIQNIAAYGQVFEDICEEVHCFNLLTKEIVVFENKDCHFSYRSSYFKNEILNKNHTLVVVAIVLKMKKKNEVVASYESNYESLEPFLLRYGKGPYAIEQIFQSIVDIRSQKLPDIRTVGSNGSLFMNPIVTGDKLKEMLKNFPDLQFYPSAKMEHGRMDKNNIDPASLYKIAAGHILEKIGWRYKNDKQEWEAKIINQVGVWKKHSLVLVNYGSKNPQDILDYIRAMQSSFLEKTGIDIKLEINII